MRDTLGQRFDHVDDWHVRPGCTAGGHVALPLSGDSRVTVRAVGEPSAPWHVSGYAFQSVCRGELTAAHSIEEMGSCRPLRCDDARRDCVHEAGIRGACVDGYCVRTTLPPSQSQSFQDMVSLCLAALPRTGREAEVSARLQALQGVCDATRDSCSAWPAECGPRVP